MDIQAMDQVQANHMMATILPAIFFFGLLVTAAIIVPFWVAFKKAGMPGPLALMVLIPGIGFLLTLYVLAFARWKVVPAPEYAYPPQTPPPGYAAAYPQYPASSAPPVGGYTTPGAYTPAPQAYPPPPQDPPASL